MIKLFETDGTHNGKPIHCPIGDLLCPCCDEDNICHSSDPLEDCDDFGAYYDSWDEYEGQASNDCSGDCESCDRWNWCQDVEDDVDETGFNPYEGGYDYDC